MKVILDIPEIPTNDHQRWALANGKPYPRGKWNKKKSDSAYLLVRKCLNCNNRSAVGNFCMWRGADMREEGDPNENCN